jgi:hypothetical protein
MIFIIIWFDIASEEIELNANPFNPFFMSENNMNSDSVNEYISWLEEFRKIYSKYIDSSEELREIFAGTLEKFHKILRRNIVNTEENIIKSLKELVRKFSVAYDTNKNINKTLEGPRNTDAFKQAIYEREIAKLKESLIANINDPKFEYNFESIVMFVAKKRQMIEFLKLGKLRDDENIEKCIYFEIFGKKREIDDELKSYMLNSKAEYLYKEFTQKHITDIQHKYIYQENKIPLTKCNFFTKIKYSCWIHTNTNEHPILFQIMNELYSRFLSNSNNTRKKNILVELYWLYIQTCPFERGSASIGEVIFSVLLRKYFRCDFLISNGWDGNPEIIPDIFALTYDLDEFKNIFWGQLTNCSLKKKSNNNNRNYLRDNKYFYYL